MSTGIASRTGRAWLFGDNVDTDQMAPLSAMPLEPSDRRAHLFPSHPRFVEGVQAGDVIVAGRNWGCGSSREQAPQNLIELGIAAVVAESFARIYFRNTIALGAIAVECLGISSSISDGDQIEVDIASAVVRNLTRGTDHPARAYTNLMLDIVSAGGLLASLARRSGSGQPVPTSAVPVPSPRRGP
jgi:3-isopropylmalate/(R)-2-methylmalate dehydratase small subunit